MKKLWLLATLIVVTSCRTDENVIHSTPIGTGDVQEGAVSGFYLLNEGNMGSNKASLDYYDYATGVYTRNIFAERNPSVAHELGDVGNDLKVYGEKLYAVVNCSNLIEVMDVRTAGHVGSISIPNCRYITFHGRFAYASSYAGPVQLDPSARPGYVAKIDTASLAVVAECTVGYQPEQLTVANDRLYVANSGGYRFPNYDTRISVIDLSSFTVRGEIETGLINLHRLAADAHGQLWVSSRGDNGSVPARVACIDLATQAVMAVLEVPCHNMTLYKDELFVLTEHGDCTVIDTRTRKIARTLPLASAYQHPYGLAINPHTGDILLTDARDYVTPGYVHAYSSDGTEKWSVQAGDIPAHIAFVYKPIAPNEEKNPNKEEENPNKEEENPGKEEEDPSENPQDQNGAKFRAKTADSRAESSIVLEYRPAPGQFINEGYTAATMEQACAYAADRLTAKIPVSLGAWGGSITVGFDHSIASSGGYDLQITGNAFNGSSEPGIVWVSQDCNNNGLADDPWYELAGSDYANEIRGYEITYNRPEGERQPVRWTDNRGGAGEVAYMGGFHNQPFYYPAWIAADSYTIGGSKLPSRTVEQNGLWINQPFEWGYADNASAIDRLGTTTKNHLKIADAVTGSGEKANLKFVDFVRIQTAVSAQAGIIGEVSTEVCAVQEYTAATRATTSTSSSAAWRWSTKR